MNARPITDRMAEARAKAVAWRRVPKAYYLGPDDYAEFLATSPPPIAATFRNMPSQELGFHLLPVREAVGLTNAGKSRLYCTSGSGFEVPAS